MGLTELLEKDVEIAKIGDQIHKIKVEMYERVNPLEEQIYSRKNK